MLKKIKRMPEGRKKDRGHHPDKDRFEEVTEIRQPALKRAEGKRVHAVKRFPRR